MTNEQIKELVLNYADMLKEKGFLECFISTKT